MNSTTLDQDGALRLETAAPGQDRRLRTASDAASTTIHHRGEVGDSPEATEPPPRLGRRVLIAGVAIVAVALAAAYYFKYVAPYESTDDAFIEAHVTAVAPQVPGRVLRLLVDDNQFVKQGDTLVQIDPRDFQAQLDKAQADLAAARSRLDQARASFTVDQAKAKQEEASVTAAEAENNHAQADLGRYQSVEVRAISRSELDLAQSTARALAAQLDVARNKALAAEAQVALSQANIQTAQANVEQNEALVRQAELNLSYTRVTAPEDGYVTRRTVEAGNYAQLGEPLLAIVPRQVWVVANFKETQLDHMRPGQPVTMTVDAYPGVKFTGHVESLQAGTGARFSLFPPENASGNYVKVVQRVPVRIALDKVSDPKLVLGPGMSVVPEVRVQ